MAMNSQDYVKAFKASIVRIFHPNGAVVGAGFLVSPQHMLTCAHVVTTALGIRQDTVEMPTGAIDLDFPLIAAGQKIQAEVVFWRPVNPSAVGEDIAGLKLLGKPPDVAQSVGMLTAEDFWGDDLRVFGFPSGHNDGVWATGVLRGESGNGWIQMEAVNVPGYQVEPGFSGAPVWDEKLAGVVGMAVAAEKQREGVKAAFMIPAKVLIQAWSELVAFSTPIPPVIRLNGVQQLKAQLLQERLKCLEADYQAAYNQLNYTLSASDRNMLKRQSDSIYQEIAQVASELDSL
jgi:V8-like Glu-specific endopeptidase